MYLIQTVKLKRQVEHHNVEGRRLEWNICIEKWIDLGVHDKWFEMC